MPTYLYECPQCGQFERFLRLADHRREVGCSCGLPSIQVITPVNFSKPMEAYECPVTGKIISSVQAHKDNLARTGCHIVEPGEDRDAAIRAKRNDDLLDAQLDKSLDQALNSMPAAKKAQLCAEVMLDPNIDSNILTRN